MGQCDQFPAYMMTERLTYVVPPRWDAMAAYGQVTPLGQDFPSLHLRQDAKNKAGRVGPTIVPCDADSTWKPPHESCF